MIASDRVIVESFFCRMKTLWAITSDCYSSKRDHYDISIQTCVAPTNVHIRILPLRDVDGHDFNRYVNRLLSIGEKIKSKRTSSMVKCRKHRLRTLLPVVDDLHYDSDAEFYDSAENSGIFD
jgi:hypothetical protein